MKITQATFTKYVIPWLACLVICRVIVLVVSNYVNYFPPNFGVEFLRGREDYFFGSYQWAFYLHILTGPISLILGMILLSETVRRKFRRWHRWLGRVQAVNVLFLVAPSGLWMSAYVDSFRLTGMAFATQSFVTGLTIAMGWRAAVKRQFQEHRRWMIRNFLLLSSAVVLRLVFGTASLFQYEEYWLFPAVAWGSWVLPLLIFEAFEWGVTGNRSLKPIPPTVTQAAV